MRLVFVLLMAFGMMAHASTENEPPKKPPKTHTPPTMLQQQQQEMRQHQYQGQEQANQQTVSTDLKAAASAAGGTGGSATMSTHYEAQAPDVVLVPNNNTERCLRVFGLGWSSQDGGGGLGIPYRSAPCDYEQAGDDAAAEGNHSLAWYWRCHKKSLYKTYRDRGESKAQAITDCHDQMAVFTGDKQTISQLQNDLAFIQNERKIEQQHFNDEKARIDKACEESKDRLFAGCVKK